MQATELPSIELFDEELLVETHSIGINTLPPLKVSGLKPEQMASIVKKSVSETIEKGKFPVILGGEHSVTIGAVRAAKKKYNDRMHHVQWLCQDISKTLPLELNDIDIWIDRAVLHFLTDEDDIKGYFENVKSTLKTGGHAIFAEFSKTGAPKCAGLTLHRYSIGELSEKLGSSFKLISHFDYTYINPNGDPRPYVYALYKRENKHG